MGFELAQYLLLALWSLSHVEHINKCSFTGKKRWMLGIVMALLNCYTSITIRTDLSDNDRPAGLDH